MRKHTICLVCGNLENSKIAVQLNIALSRTQKNLIINDLIHVEMSLRKNQCTNSEYSVAGLIVRGVSCLIAKSKEISFQPRFNCVEAFKLHMACISHRKGVEWLDHNKKYVIIYFSFFFFDNTFYLFSLDICLDNIFTWQHFYLLLPFYYNILQPLPDSRSRYKFVRLSYTT